MAWVVPAILFCITLLTTTFAGLLYAGFGDGGLFLGIVLSLNHPSLLLQGLPFSLTFIAILLAHELGHYFACVYYRIRCTPPYFIPFPISIAGTLGAFIRIKSPFPNRKALFDVGIAGPLAGFILVIPALLVGIALSSPVAKSQVEAQFGFGEPPLFRWFSLALLDYTPGTEEILAHPIAIAAWFGLLATCLNLFPIWQLDGGHIAYALLGRVNQRKLSIGAILVLMSASFLSWPLPSYLVFGTLLLIMGYRFRFYHPPTLSDAEELGRGRQVLGFVALIVLVVSFTPVPIYLS